MRPLTSDDIEPMVRLAVAAELFPPEAGDFLREQAHAWLNGGEGPGAWAVDDDEGGGLGSVVFYEPRLATDRVWALTMIAVAPALQGSGRGARALRWVEDTLRARGQRLLVIETSSTPRYDKTRRFYERSGYRQVAVVPDYFEDGDDMVLFHKDLRVAPA